MRPPWALLLLLAVALAAFWALGRRQREPMRPPAAPEQDGDRPSPGLQGKGPAGVPSEPGARRRERGLRLVSVRGRVVDGAGRPLLAAQVQAAGAQWRGVPLGVGVDGGFAHEMPVLGAVGALRVLVTAPEHLPWLGPWLDPSEGRAVDLGVVTLRPAHAIAGQVFFEDGSVASEVQVAAVPEADVLGDLQFAGQTAGASHPNAWTDERGRFRIDPLPPGAYTVIVPWGAWNEVAVQGVEAGGSPVTVRIPRSAEAPKPPPPAERILVDLATEDGGAPPSCQAALTRQGERWPGVQSEARLTFPVPSPGPYTLFVWPVGERYASRALRGLEVRDGPYTVTLRRALTVAGVVSADGAPVAGASVRAEGRLLHGGGVEVAPPAGDGIFEQGAWEAETDEQGRFEVLGVPPGAVRLTVSHTVLHRRGGPLVVEAGSRGLVVPMRPDPVIRVRVHSPDGENVGSVEVEVWRVAPGGRAWETRITDWAWGRRTGRYARRVASCETRVSDPDAEYAVTASSESETAEGESPLVRGIRPDAAPTDIRLAARPPLRVEVVDEAGRPLPGVHVEMRRFPEGRPVLREPSYWVPVHRDSPGWPDDGHTGPDGVYAFERRLPPGPWAVLAQAAGTAQTGRLPRVDDAQETVRVVLHRGLRLLGKVESPQGRSQWARFLEAWPVDGQQESVLVETLPASGRFEFTNLAPGRYVLVSRPNNSFHDEEHNFHAVSEPVPAGAHEVVLTLRPGHRSTLDLRGPEGVRLAHAEVRVVGRQVDRAVVADKDGLFQAIALPPGDYAFQVKVEGREPFSLAFKAGESVAHRLRP